MNESWSGGLIATLCVFGKSSCQLPTAEAVGFLRRNREYRPNDAK
jgi:hypothetical protein